MKRSASSAVGIAIVLAMISGLVYWLVGPDGSGPVPEPTPTVAKVIGTVGSEKKAFFDDPKVKEELRLQGLEVSAQSAGSWQMNDVKAGSADFAFPASSPPADAIQKANGITGTPVRPFYSPLVVVAHRTTAEVLKSQGLAARNAGNVWTLTMDTFIRTVVEGRKWEQIQPENRPRELSGDIYLTTTDPDLSSSGALYIGMAAYLLNNKEVAQDEAAVQRIGPGLKAAFTRQGAMQTSTDQPFTDFASNNGRPLVLAYESQALELVAKGAAPDDMVVLYPDTAVISDHSIVAFTDNGRKFADVLLKNDRLRELALQHGFRPAQSSSGESPFKAYVNKLNTTRPNTPFAFDPALDQAKVVLPRQEILMSLIKATK
ncbi:substrate-binding domain-containing protein [Kitasatospora sp. NPDC056327]|uniref:substrate-binding domain-containing protein n=1 Tax=Kitasatospora sp. NPDC056327 TaxID=3345785 RepID=UPI0035DC95C7